MKILTTEQLRKADKYTIDNEPVSSTNLMERAATACAQWIKDHYPHKNVFNIFCGTGNNGGDGLVIARHLLQDGFVVNVFIIKTGSEPTNDFKINSERLTRINSDVVKEVDSINDLVIPGEDTVIVDAILGSGLTRALDGLIAEVVKIINSSQAEVVSIDAPTGLFTDKATEYGSGKVIKANHTLTFQLPKLAFLFACNEQFTGEFHILNIGLSKEFLTQATTDNYLLTLNDIKKLIRKRKKFSHKGVFGHALIVAGSYGRMGAAVLSVRACLKTGAGLVTAHVPKSGNEIMQVSVPEAMTEADSFEESISDSLAFDKYNAVGIGPGLGTSAETTQALKLMIQDWNSPMVFDADAINILSENKTWLSFIPANSIFTPHPKEFERLTEKPRDDFHRFDLQKSFSRKYNCVVVLKGAHTCITCPDGTNYFNSTGNPGMATAGSGDALTGIITSLLAQGYSPKVAAIIGVYLHGLAGDIAASEKSEAALIASDIIESIGKAFLRISGK